MKQENNYDLIKFVDGEFSLDVNVSPKEDTVWLSANQMAILFERDEKTIRKHINNVFKEQEVEKNSNTHFLRVTGVAPKVAFYSLNVVISIGYRVKSQRGVKFRVWATSVLKEYLLKGITIQEKRCLMHSDNLNEINQQLFSHNLRLTYMEEKLDSLTDKENILQDKLFYENQIFDAYSYIKQLFLSAKSSIILIDGYIDISVLDMLKEVKVPITIYTYPNAQLSNQDITKFSIGHRVEVYRTSLIHDRFIIIDSMIYSIGASIKDAGKKRFVMTKLESISTNDLVKKL